MKITLEPRKTTWVPFIDSEAKLEIEWTAKIEYTSWSASQNSTHNVDMRYIFTNLDGAQFIPSSQLIIKEEGIPLAITETVVSPVKDRFRSERLSDPFIEINDRLASIEKSKVATKKLSKRMIERKWTETINRSIKIENKTGKNVLLKLTVVDQPAEELIFVTSTPEATKKEPPEYFYDVELARDAIQTIKIELTHKKLEKLELPPEHVKGEARRRLATANQEALYFDEYEEAEEAVQQYEEEQ
jgi:hypothetical protein